MFFDLGSLARWESGLPQQWIQGNTLHPSGATAVATNLNRSDDLWINIRQNDYDDRAVHHLDHVAESVSNNWSILTQNKTANLQLRNHQRRF